MDKKSVFIVGAKSIGQYGGFETFVNKLIEYSKDIDCIQYYVACKANGDGHMDESKAYNVTKINDEEFLYYNAKCYKIRVPQIGSAQAIIYDIKAIRKFIEIIKRDKIKEPIIYILACRIGLFIKHYVDEIHKLGGKVYINPDGHEWLRGKWCKPIKKYWKYSESQMVKFADLVICDSKNIEKYIHEEYDGKCANGNPKTTYISYGAEIKKSILKDDDKKWIDWLKSNDLEVNNYFLVVGRFVQENNHEIIIREFLKSKTKKSLVVISNDNPKFYKELNVKLDFEKDNRVKFVGTVYDQELLKKIRENAFAYIHGHEVGGTNPSLLEALASTKLNLLLDVPFNREVAEDGAMYWNKEDGCLSKLIDKDINGDKIESLSKKAIVRIENEYKWDIICNKYREVMI